MNRLIRLFQTINQLDRTKLSKNQLDHLNLLHGKVLKILNIPEAANFNLDDEKILLKAVDINLYNKFLEHLEITGSDLTTFIRPKSTT
jgi:hypothetical protein